MSFASDWANSTKQIRQTYLLGLINGPWPPTLDYMDIDRTHGHSGIYASSGLKFNNALFGRDSIIVAEDLLLFNRTLVHDIIITLGKLQGHQLDLHTEEEPGKIHHEYRTQHLIDETTAIPLSSLQHLLDLEHDWGIQGHEYFIYYGTYDATPLYVRLLGKYIEQYGSEILSEKYINRSGDTYSVHDSVRAALTWITAKVEASKSGLLEFKRLNPNALRNQSWKDSATAYLHADGSLADGDRGIASVELQGYTYDALLAGSQYFAEDEQQSAHWQKLAAQIQEHCIHDLWMEKVHFFAEGLDHDAKGIAHQIDTLTSNSAVLLGCKLLLDLPAAQRQPIVDGIVHLIYSAEFITEAGVRSRALRHQNMPGFVDYHGSFTVWPKETQAIAQGLHAHGYAKLAEQLENRLLRSVLLSGEFYELFYVGADNTVWYDPEAAIQYFASKNPNVIAPMPEPGQAWTISAVLNILYNRHQSTTSDPTLSVNATELSLLASLPTFTIPTTLDNIAPSESPSFTSPA